MCMCSVPGMHVLWGGGGLDLWGGGGIYTDQIPPGGRAMCAEICTKCNKIYSRFALANMRQ